MVEEVTAIFLGVSAVLVTFRNQVQHLQGNWGVCGGGWASLGSGTSLAAGSIWD